MMAETKEDPIYDVCSQYGVVCEYDGVMLNIKFKNGKLLSYVISSNVKLNIKKQSFNEAITRLPFSHGRIFKDGKFIDYAPQCQNLGEILIAVDMVL